ATCWTRHACTDAGTGRDAGSWRIPLPRSAERAGSRATRCDRGDPCGCRVRFLTADIAALLLVGAGGDPGSEPAGGRSRPRRLPLARLPGDAATLGRDGGLPRRRG